MKHRMIRTKSVPSGEKIVTGIVYQPKIMYNGTGIKWLPEIKREKRERGV